MKVKKNITNMIGFNVTEARFKERAENIFRDNLNQELYSDLLLICGTKNGSYTFFTHQIILASTSTFVEKAVKSLKEAGMTNQGKVVLYIDGISKQVMNLILEYVYTGTVRVQEYLKNSFLRATKRFGLKGLDKESNKQSNIEVQDITSKVKEPEMKEERLGLREVGKDRKKHFKIDVLEQTPEITEPLVKKERLELRGLERQHNKHLENDVQNHEIIGPQVKEEMLDENLNVDMEHFDGDADEIDNILDLDDPFNGVSTNMEFSNNQENTPEEGSISSNTNSVEEESFSSNTDKIEEESFSSNTDKVEDLYRKRILPNEMPKKGDYRNPNAKVDLEVKVLFKEILEDLQGLTPRYLNCLKRKRPNVCIACPEAYFKSGPDLKRHLMVHFRKTKEFLPISEKIEKCLDKLSDDDRNCVLCLDEVLQGYHHFTKKHLCRNEIERALSITELSSESPKKRKFNADINKFWI